MWLPGKGLRNYRFSANVQVIVDADTRLVVAAARPVLSTVTPWHWAGAVRRDFGAQSPPALGAGQWHARAGPVDLLPGDAALAPETLQGEVQDAVLGELASWDRAFRYTPS